MTTVWYRNSCDGIKILFDKQKYNMIFSTKSISNELNKKKKIYLMKY